MMLARVDRSSLLGEDGAGEPWQIGAAQRRLGSRPRAAHNAHDEEPDASAEPEVPRRTSWAVHCDGGFDGSKGTEASHVTARPSICSSNR